MVIDNCFRTPKNRVRHLVLPEYRFLTTSEYVCCVLSFPQCRHLEHSYSILGFCTCR